jgi:hypothetical protein
MAAHRLTHGHRNNSEVTIVAYFVGAVLALSIGLSGTIIGLDRERAFYPTIVAVIASYYALFAVMGGSLQALAVESIPIAVFLGVSIAGYKRSLWLVVVALAGHGAFDAIHGRLIINAGVPTWWPQFCLAYDVVAAAYLASLLFRSRVSAAPT